MDNFPDLGDLTDATATDRIRGLVGDAASTGQTLAHALDYLTADPAFGNRHTTTEALRLIGRARRELQRFGETIATHATSPSGPGVPLTHAATALTLDPKTLRRRLPNMPNG